MAYPQARVVEPAFAQASIDSIYSFNSHCYFLHQPPVEGEVDWLGNFSFLSKRPLPL